MTKTTLAVLGSLTLASAGISIGLLATDRAPPRPVNSEGLRWAVFGRECPTENEPAAWEYAQDHCFHVRSITCGGKDGCLCQTDEPSLQGEIELDSMPNCAYRRIGICRWRDNQNRWLSEVQVRPVGWNPPSGMTCTVIANRVLVWESRPGQKAALEDALETKCGWPVSGDSWGCCPHCLLWTNGCPPCRGLCRYGNAWTGHEAECQPGI